MTDSFKSTGTSPRFSVFSSWKSQLFTRRSRRMRNRQAALLLALRVPVESLERRTMLSYPVQVTFANGGDGAVYDTHSFYGWKFSLEVLVNGSLKTTKNGVGSDYPSGNVSIGFLGGNTIFTMGLLPAVSPDAPEGVPLYSSVALFDPSTSVGGYAPSMSDVGSGTKDAAGDYMLVATYSGNGNFDAGTSYPGAAVGTLPAPPDNQTFAGVAFDTPKTGLKVLSPPTDTAPKTAISPVSVQLLDTSGNPDTTSTTMVTVAIASGSSGTGKLSGTLTKAAVNGVVTFSDLTIDKPGNYTLSFTDSDATINSVAFNITGDKLSFPATQIPTTAVGAKIPPVTVSVLDSSGNPDLTATGTVDLTLSSASRLNTSTGSLGGNATATISNGQAVFDTLTVSEAGTYQLNATDSNNDASAISGKFKIGTNTLQLALTAKAPRGKKGVKPGDKIFYTFAITPPQTVQSRNLVFTIPVNFIVLSTFGGGNQVGDTIVYDAPTLRGGTFELQVPVAKYLVNLPSIVVSGDDKVVYTDASTDEATATTSVKIGTSFEVDGTMHDAIFKLPQVSTVVTSAPLAGVIVALVDSTGATVATTKTNGTGKFKLTAKVAGTYKVTFSVIAGRYSAVSNSISNAGVFASSTVTLGPGNVEPVDLGNLVMPRTFLQSSAKILMNLNNYQTSSFGGLELFTNSIWQFNTSAAEAVLNGLAGTAANPGVFMDPTALQVGGSTDAWVAAIRMMAGLYEVNQRFNDAFKLVDLSGKALSVLLSVQLAKDTDIALQAKRDAGATDVPWLPKNPLVPLSESAAALNNGEKVSLFGVMGEILPQVVDNLLAQLQLPTSYKSAFFTAAFGGIRFGYSLLTGQKLITDGLFEAVFNLIRIGFDAIMLQGFAGVSLRADAPLELKVLLLPDFLIGSAISNLPPNLQDVINTCVNNRLVYNTNTDTNSVLDTLALMEEQGHSDQIKELFLVGYLNNVSSVSRSIDGAAGLLNKAKVASTGTGYQKALASVVSKASTSFENVFVGTNAKIENVAAAGTKGGTKFFAGAILIPGFAAAAFGFIEQLYVSQSIPSIVLNDINPPLGPIGSSAVLSDGADQSAATAQSAPTVSAAAVDAPVASPMATTPISLPSDATTFLADMQTISTLVKAKDTTSITAMYAQFVSDSHALFDSDLVVLDNQADALTSQLTGSSLATAANFDVALNNALDAVTFASEQLDLWGTSPATANATLVINQISTAIKDVQSAAAMSPTVRSIVGGFSIPASFQIDQSAVPIQAAANSTQMFTVTITNVGNQASDAGTINFNNSDGTLVVQSPAQQTLPALAPGASTTLSWQVEVLPQQNASFGSVYQIQAVAGDTIGTTTGQVLVNG